MRDSSVVEFCRSAAARLRAEAKTEPSVHAKLLALAEEFDHHAERLERENLAEAGQPA